VPFVEVLLVTYGQDLYFYLNLANVLEEGHRIYYIKEDIIILQGMETLMICLHKEEILF
jgi:hypothetical protein